MTLLMRSQGCQTRASFIAAAIEVIVRCNDGLDAIDRAGEERSLTKHLFRSIVRWQVPALFEPGQGPIRIHEAVVDHLFDVREFISVWQLKELREERCAVGEH